MSTMTDSERFWRFNTEYNYGAIRDSLRLVTAGYQMFTDPYGPYHSGAVGKLYAWDRMPYDFESHKYETYVSHIDPSLGEDELYPVEFVRRTGEFIEVRIDFTSSRLWDRHEHDGELVKLYPWTEGDRL